MALGISTVSTLDTLPHRHSAQHNIMTPILVSSTYGDQSNDAVQDLLVCRGAPSYPTVHEAWQR